ncbi:hypothetical protein ACLOAV_004713 [Pseudogymnoascus australis]
MDAPSGAVNAPTGNHTRRINAAISKDVFTRWTTTALGKGKLQTRLAPAVQSHSMW